MSVRVAVLASGGGSNLQALLDRFNTADAATARIALVLSDRAGAGALERAGAAAVEARFLEHAKDAHTAAPEMLAALKRAEIDVIALAGYLRLVPADVVRRYPYRMVNIHPALLPAFGGQGLYGGRVHEAVLAAGCRVSGATVHFVDGCYDTGPILAQWPVPVLAGDTAATLAARVLRVEHRLYPAAIERLAATIAAGGDPLTLLDAGLAFEEPAAFALTSDDASAGDALRRALVAR
ncbi:MAG: phosphoribosylglycinamide formyltransferase [Longimicrobiales bacterium]